MSGEEYLLKHITQRYKLVFLKDGGELAAHPYPKGEDTAFIFHVLRCFAEKSFLAADFEPYSIEIIIEYIRRTHALYLQKILPEIDRNIQLMCNHHPAGHPVLFKLQVCCQHYYKELAHHLEEEERHLLPYIARLVGATRGAKGFAAYVSDFGKYSLEQFIAGHDDTGEGLVLLRQTADMYPPPEGNQSLFRILRLQLQTLELDLHVHSRIEEDVLIPKALKIEAQIQRRLKRLGRSN